MSANPIARAIEAMLEERAVVAGRLALLDDVIAKTRAVLGVPVDAPSATPTTPKPAAKMVERSRAPKGVETLTDDSVRRALRDRGPLSPGEFSSVFGLESTYRRKLALDDLIARGVVEVAGGTTNRRISLPVKEVP